VNGERRGQATERATVHHGGLAAELVADIREAAAGGQMSRMRTHPAVRVTASRLTVVDNGVNERAAGARIMLAFYAAIGNEI